MKARIIPFTPARKKYWFIVAYFDKHLEQKQVKVKAVSHAGAKISAAKRLSDPENSYYAVILIGE